MNPRVEVTITDHYGSYSDLRDEYGEPIEIYINDERVYTEEQVTQLKDENDRLRELLHDAAIELYVNGNITDGATELLFDQMREFGIEVE